MLTDTDSQDEDVGLDAGSFEILGMQVDTFIDITDVEEDAMQIDVSIHDATCASTASATLEKLKNTQFNETTSAKEIVSGDLGEIGASDSKARLPQEVIVIVEQEDVHDNINVAATVHEASRTASCTSQNLEISNLCKLLEETEKIGRDIEGKDVILLMGATGAGKTTTLLYLLGVSFEENDESLEYTPQSWPGWMQADSTKYEISSGSRSCTRVLQATRLKIDSKEIILCDTPGFGDTEGLDFDIANGFGMIHALRRAHTVKPVLILNKSCLEDRFHSLTDVLNTVIRMTNPAVKIDFSLFSFVFTRCTAKNGKRVHKQLSQLRQEISCSNHPQHSKELYSLLTAMVNETAGHVLYVDLDENNHKLLRNSLVNKAMAKTILNPKEFFQPFAAATASSALRGSLLSMFDDLEQLIIVQESTEENDHKIEELIQQVRVLSKANLFLLDETEIKKLERLFLEQCRIHFQNILGFSSLQNKALLSDSVCRLRRVLVVIYDLQLVNAIIELENDMNSFVNNLVEPLKMGKTLDISVNPTDLAWNCLRLKLVAGKTDGIPGFGYVQESYHKSIDCLNHLVCISLRSMKASFAKSLGQLPRRRPELIFVVSLKQSLQKADCLDTDDVLFISELARLMTDLESKYKEIAEALALDGSKLQDTIKEFVNNVSAIPSLATSIRLHARNFLLSAVGPQAVYKVVFGNNGWDEFRKEIAKFDAIFQQFVMSCEQCLSKRIHCLSSGNEEDFTKLENEAQMIQERLNELGTLCRKAQSWDDFNSEVVDKVLGKVNQHQELIKSYIRGLDEELQKHIRGCRGARIAAENFLQRLNSDKEQLSSLLLELNEADRWSCWSNLVSEEGTMWKKVNFFVRKGFWHESEHSRLTSTMKPIVSLIKSAVSIKIDSLNRSLSPMPQENLPFVTALVAQQSESIQVYISLLKTRKDSSLRMLLLDLSMQRKLSLVQLKLVQAFRRLQELPSKLIQERQFSEMRSILKEYQNASELWKKLHSFANISSSLLCIDNQSKEAIEELQEYIRSCQSFQELLDTVFTEVKKVNSDVAAIAFDYSNCGYIERFTYFEGLERLVGAVTGFGQYHVFPLSIEQKEMLNIEDVTLSRLADETEYVAVRLKKLLHTFPSQKSDYLHIHTCLALLDFIEIVFRTSKPSLARNAYFAKEDVEKLAVVNLKSSQDRIIGSLPLSADTICEQLLMWKRCSYEIANWRNFSDDCLDKTLFSLTSGKSSTTLLDIALKLRAIQGDDAITANQILSEHSMFDGIMNSLFDDATRGQDINYVLTGLNDLSENDKVKLIQMYEVYSTMYDTTLDDGLLHANRTNSSSELEEFLKKLKSKASASVNNFCIDFWQQISELTGILFAHWSLSSNMSCIIGTSSSTLGENVHPKKYLKKPHAAQVVATWLMLNAFADDCPNFGNVLVELKTGEGKSIVLGVAATILAILGFKVDCVCYSTFLSNRDYQDFHSMFHCFGVEDAVKYGTIEEFSRYQQLEGAKGYWHLAESFVKGDIPIINSKNDDKLHPPRILLIDEVDVFFGKDVFGETFRPVLRLASDHVKDIFHSAWKNANTADASTITDADSQKLIDSFPKESQKLIENEFRDLLNAAQSVRKEQPVNYIVHDGMIQYKHFDGLISSYGDYYTLFRYIKEAELGRLLKATAEHRLGLAPVVGEISHAELPLE